MVAIFFQKVGLAYGTYKFLIGIIIRPINHIKDGICIPYEEKVNAVFKELRLSKDDREVR